MKVGYHHTKEGLVTGAEFDLRDLRQWRPTVAQLRDVLLNGYVVAPSLPEGMVPDRARQFMPRQAEVDACSEMAQAAARAGRLIDFGHLPNAVIMQTANRAGPLYTRGAFGHPFREPWLLFHTWEHGSSLYLVNLLQPDKPAGGDCEIAELEAIMIRDRALLSIGDRVILTPDETVEERWHQYGCMVAPSVWRYMPGADAVYAGQTAEGSAAGNTLDPLMTALLMLSANGVERETVRVSDKLNKARRRSGKAPIPPYVRVLSEPYVTAILERKIRGPGADQGGTHASPAPHIRRGHIRQYASGIKTFIRDTLVNVTDETRAAFTRSHYTMKT